MAHQSKLLPAQWQAVRRRWEGCDSAGFTWLSREVAAAFGVSPSRQGLAKVAAEQGWEKGGAPAPPLTPLPGSGTVDGSATMVAEGAQTATMVARPIEVADEVVGPSPACTVRKVGRPTAYRPEFADMLLDYFDVQPFTEVDVPQPNGLVKRQRMATDPPLLASFARTIGVSKATVDNWATAIDDDGKPLHPPFFEAYARAREMQEALMIRGGVLGLYDPRIVQFVLKNLCGWQDQPQREVEVAPISKEALEEQYVKVMEAAHARMDQLMKERADLLKDLD